MGGGLHACKGILHPQCNAAGSGRRGSDLAVDVCGASWRSYGAIRTKTALILFYYYFQYVDVFVIKSQLVFRLLY